MVTFKVAEGIQKTGNLKKSPENKLLSLYTGRRLNVHMTFRRRPVRLITFSLRPVSTG